MSETNPAQTSALDTFDDFEEAHADGTHARHHHDPMRLLGRIPVQLTLEVGTVTVMLSELLELGAGSVLELDRSAGAPLPIKLNGTEVGTGEAVVAGDSYGLRIVSLQDLSDLKP